MDICTNLTGSISYGVVKNENGFFYPKEYPIDFCSKLPLPVPCMPLGVGSIPNSACSEMIVFLQEKFSFWDNPKPTHLPAHELIKTVPGQLSQVLAAIELYYPKIKILEVQSMIVNKQKLLTTSYDPMLDHFVGLHIDGSHHHPAKRNKLKSAIKLVLNLGTDVRSFLYSEVGVDLIADRYQIDIDQVVSDRLKDIFLPDNLDVALYRLEPPPCSFYVAPVFSIIHDGSSYLMNNTDICLSLLVEIIP